MSAPNMLVPMEVEPTMKMNIRTKPGSVEQFRQNAALNFITREPDQAPVKPAESTDPMYTKDVRDDDTYVIHAHGMMINSVDIRRFHPRLRVYSPTSCAGASLRYNPTEQDSAQMIKASCPGSEEESYVLSNYDVLSEMRFESELTEYANDPYYYTGLGFGVGFDYDKINFLAGVYKCSDDLPNHYHPEPVIRIGPGSPATLSGIIDTLLQISPSDRGINLVISTCFEVVPEAEFRRRLRIDQLKKEYGVGDLYTYQIHPHLRQEIGRRLDEGN